MNSALPLSKAPSPGQADLSGLLLPEGPLPAAVRLRRDGAGRVVGRLHSVDLSSVFQPILALPSWEPVGHKGLIHCQADMALSPWTLFSRNTDDDGLVALDRLCRTLHALNFATRPRLGGVRLHLSVHLRLLEAIEADHGKVFAAILDRIGLRPSDVVIELPEGINARPQLLCCVATNFRRNGYGVALEYGGENYRWLLGLSGGESMILKVNPSRLPSNTSLEALTDAAQRQGFLVLVTHIETTADYARAVAAKARLGQGFHFAHPKDQA